MKYPGVWNPVCSAMSATERVVSFISSQARFILIVSVFAGWVENERTVLVQSGLFGNICSLIIYIGCISGRHKEPGTVYLYNVFCWHGTRYVRLAEDISYCIILCKTIGGTGPEFMVCVSRGSDILFSCGLRFLYVNHWRSMPWNVLPSSFASFVRIKAVAEKIIINDASQWQWEV